MNQRIDFIGLGAQKSGTSWAYTCLYEHPAVCTPVKEIHFFSRPRYAEGISWYESQFKNCDATKICGEWSTSYFYDVQTPERIHAAYPNVKLLVILRNPITRAFSQYRNAIRAGEIPKNMDFRTYSMQEESVWGQGRYGEQLERYYRYFPKKQVLVLLYEDIKKDPVVFMRRIYDFLGIDQSFVAPMVHTEVNIARTPSFVGIDRVMHHSAEFLRKHGLDRMVHYIKRLGIPSLIRSVNTEKQSAELHMNDADEVEGRKLLYSDVARLSELLERDLITEWGFAQKQL